MLKNGEDLIRHIYIESLIKNIDNNNKIILVFGFVSLILISYYPY